MVDCYLSGEKCTTLTDVRNSIYCLTGCEHFTITALAKDDCNYILHIQYIFLTLELFLDQYYDAISVAR